MSAKRTDRKSPTAQFPDWSINFYASGNTDLFHRWAVFLFPAKGTRKLSPFNGWSKSKAALDKLANIPHWTLRDLRRTFRTNLGRLKVRPNIAERLVNHISARTEMEEVYDLHSYLPEIAASYGEVGSVCSSHLH
jgi:integrase